jgi:carbon monoxide dehydrogenase subunit G
MEYLLSTSASRTVTTSQPVDKVAEFLSDFTTTAEWDPHTVSCTRLDDGPLGVGARFENVQHLVGRDSTLTYEVTEYEPGRRIVLEGGNDTVRSRDEMLFDGTADGGTQVTYNVEIELRGLAKLGQPALAVGLKKVADEGADGMQRRLAAL